MSTNLLIIAAFSLLIASCKSKDAVPGNVLPQDKMQAVLWDIMRADQFLSDYVLNKDTSLKKATESIKLYQQVLAINGVTKEKFERSFSFYKTHPLLLKVIMDSIVNAPSEVPATTGVVADTSGQSLVKDSAMKIVDSSALGRDSILRLKKSRKLIKPN